MLNSKATLNLTPWAHRALSDQEMSDLGYRLVELHARMGIGKSSKGWTIRIESWAEGEHHEPLHKYASHHLKGNLAQHANACLSVYERQFAFTPDELVTIANQSGMAVTRA